MDGRGITHVRVQTEAERTIGFGVPGIDAQSGAGFRDGAVGIIVAIEQVSQPAMYIGKGPALAFRNSGKNRKPRPNLPAAGEHSPGEVQTGIRGIGRDQLLQCGLSFLVPFLMNELAGIGERFGTTGRIQFICGRKESGLG